MESITIFIKNKKKFEFLYQFLQHLDFVIVPPLVSRRKSNKSKEYSIFNSAGIWEGRDITQENLRAKAWKRA